MTRQMYVMAGLIEKLKKLLQLQKQQVQMEKSTGAHLKRREGETAVLTEELIVELMEQLKHTHENQYSCADSYALLDEYVDLVADDRDAELLMPLVKAHLDACPDCHQKFEILLDILKADSS